MRKIGVVGLGIMGHGIADNFLKAGYELFVWNRSKENAKDLVNRGAIFVDSPKAVSVSSDIIFEVVSDDEASRSVWFGEDGILAGANPKKVLITSASLSLDYLDELISTTKKAGLRFLDIPLTGSRAGAENGKLKLLAGGNKALLDGIQKELNAISDKVYYFGEAGSGMRFKLILNTIQAIQVNAAAQAIELAKKSGLDIKAMHHAIFDAPMGAASGATNAVFQGTEANHVNFAVKLIEKDLRYAQAMAKQFNVDFDLLNDTQKDFSRAKEKGLADQDWSKIINLFKAK